MKTIYINCKWGGLPIETVDEFPYDTKENRKESFRCLKEYAISDRTGYYYLSSRCTKAWKEK